MKRMPAFLRDRLFVTWALLVAVTLFSAEVGGGASWFGKPAVVTAAVLGIAFAKAWMVMMTFMEVRTAPLALRALATVWLVAALSVLLAVYGGMFTAVG
jgi:hypothetical protein